MNDQEMKNEFEQQLASHLSRRGFLAGAAGATTAILLSKSGYAQDVGQLRPPCIDKPNIIGTNKTVYGEIAEEVERLEAARKSALQRPAGLGPARMPAAPQRMRAASRYLSDRVARPSVPLKLAVENRWTKKSITIRFLGGNADTKEFVRSAAAKWLDYIDLKFNFGNLSSADIRINFLNKGHWSYVGPKGAAYARGNEVGGQTMNLQLHTEPQERKKGVVLHEFGHMLGAIHEHQSAASPLVFNNNVYAWFMNNQPGWTEKDVRDNVVSRYQRNQLVNFTDFDRESIMIYWIPAAVLVDPSQAVEENNTLSKNDVKLMQTLYGEVAAPPDGGGDGGQPVQPPGASLTVGGGAVEGKIVQRGAVVKHTFKATSARRHTVKTSGYTQVELKLVDSSANGIKSEKLDKKIYFNERIVADLKPGNYTVEVRHKAEIGGGEYKIQVDAN